MTSQKVEANPSAKPLVVGIGGTTRTVSSTDRALRIALQAAEEAGARTFLFGGAFLSHLPHFAPENRERNDQQRQFLEMVRKSDGVIVASPGYHGGVSGLVKNALDLLEDLREDDPCYLDGRAVGCIVTAAGWQACVSTLMALRSIVHALRGWPTPLGATLNTTDGVFDATGVCKDEKVLNQLNAVGRQVVEFAQRHRRP
ncbi:MAG TPA: NADPH-dependent FMN reductase [Candidatus Acidoferrales bacterium]|nr:NADPH-dependent FMN reductase [Candidatus Acidoferrales bacterium]